VITLSEAKLADLWPMGDIRPPSQYRKPWDPWGAPESMIVEDDDPRGVRLDGPDADDGASSAGSEYKGNTPAPAGTKSGPPAGQAGVGREPGEGGAMLAVYESTRGEYGPDALLGLVDTLEEARSLAQSVREAVIESDHGEGDDMPNGAIVETHP
jgi:hypothetical protein